MFQRLATPLSYAKTNLQQQGITIPWLSTDFATVGTSAVGWDLTQPWYDGFGNWFSLKRMRGSALAAGQVVEWNPPGTDTALTGSTKYVVLLTTGALTADAEIGNFVFNATLAQTLSNQDALKIIKDNAVASLTVSEIDNKRTNLLRDADAYVTAPANTEALSIIRPHEMRLFPTADAAFGNPIGVGIGAIADASWGFVQIGGLALIRAVASPAATPNKPAIPSGATAGSVVSSATPVGNQLGTFAVTYNVAAAAYLPVWLQISHFA